MPFAAILTSTAITWSSVAVTGDAFCGYIGDIVDL